MPTTPDRPADAVTVLHVSDPQFGAHHLFGGNGLTPADQAYDTLVVRLTQDLAYLGDEHGLRPDLMVVTGDLAERALPDEFRQVGTFLTEVSAALGLGPERVAIVPGNHDISRANCAAHFLQRQARGAEPVKPYWPKWEQYLDLFEDFYRDVPGATFQIQQEWSLYEMADLKVVVAGLNSTMAESHLDEDHYGWVGEAQCRWFADRLRDYEQDGWLRIGAVHHNAVRKAVADDENLRDADVLDHILGRRLHLLLHGHTHSSRLSFLDSRLPVVGTGSAAVDAAARPTEVPNQYQVLALRPNRIVRYARAYDVQDRSWGGDLRVDPKKSTWQVETPWEPDKAHAALATTAAPRPPATAGYGADDPGGRDERASDLVDRVAEVSRLRNPGATVTRVRLEDGTAYLRVTQVDERVAVQRPVGVAARLDADTIARFVDNVHRSYAAADPQLTSELVHSGPADPGLAREAYRRGVRLLSFQEYQGLLDLTGYVAAQTRRLEQDAVYPPSLYVPQRFRMLEGADREVRPDALAELVGWLSSDQARFVLLLGDFGRGKTFLLHELARRLPAELPHVVPMLVELRALEKARTVDELVAQHLAASGVDRIDLTAFRYMLRTGRIALLLDGFDELALRVSYDRAADHLRTVLDAVQGQAKVVLTSRTQHFLTDQQVRTALGDRVELVPGRRLAHLEDFSDEQIRAFLVGLFDGDEQRADARLELINDVRDLLGLSRNPRMLSFIAALPEERLRAAQARSGAIGSAELYRELLGQWLGYEDRRAHPPGAAPGLGLDQRWTAVTTLALRLWSTTDRYVGVGDLDAVAAGLVADLATGQLDAGQAAQMIGSGTLLSRTEDGLFTFVHQSVMEWLVAAEAARLLGEGDAQPEVLAHREMSLLMADFVCGLAGESAPHWANAVLVDEAAAEVAKDNALLIQKRLRLEAVAPAQLAGQNLRGADLSAQDLRAGDLTGADLTEARLIGTNLAGASLRDARLTGAWLDGCGLEGADLTGADLTGARLQDSPLHEATLDGSTWVDASIQDTGFVDRPELATAAVAGRDQARPMLAPPAGDLLSVAWSPRGRLLAATQSVGCTTLIDSETMVIRRVLTGHIGAVLAVAHAPDGGRLATGGTDGTVRVWAADSGEQLARLDYAGGVSAVAWSPDGSRLAVVIGGRVLLWHPDTDERTTVLGLATGSATTVAWSPDGRWLAAALQDGRLWLWAPERGPASGTIEDWTIVRGLSWSPDGAKLATVGEAGDIHLRDLASGVMTTLTAESSPAVAVAHSPDGSLLAAWHLNGSILLWDPARGTVVRTLQGDSGVLRALSWRPDGSQFAAVTEHRTLRIVDVAAGPHAASRSDRRSPVRGIGWSSYGRLLSAVYRDGTALSWYPGTGEPEVLEARAGVRAVGHAASGGAPATAFADGLLRFWHPDSRASVQMSASAGGPMTAVAYSPNGALLATAAEDEDAVRLWDVASAQQTLTLAGHTGPATALAWAPSGSYLATADGDGTVRTWSRRTGRTVHELRRHDGPVGGLAYHPDGSRLASAGADRTVRIWDPAAGTQLRALRGHADRVRGVSWSPDGGRLASAADDGTIRLWNPATGRSLGTLRGHLGPVTAVSYSPEGDLLASGGDDATVRLWDPDTGAERAVLVRMAAGWAALLPDGSYKLEGDPDGSFWWAVKTCRFEPGELDPYDPRVRRLPAGAPILG